MAAATLLLFNGDILGASGIISSVVLSPKNSIIDESQHWKMVFLATFLVTSYLSTRPSSDARNERLLSTYAYGLAGLMVGFGTKLGNGCTSGHGICGLGRLSKRSFAAVCTFTAMAMLTTYITSPDATMFSKYTSFLHTSQAAKEDTKVGQIIASVFVGLALIATVHSGSKLYVNKAATAKLAPAAAAAFLFSRGLNRSSMVLQEKVFGFLDVTGISDGSFDISLAFVMGGGVVVSFISYQLVNGLNVIDHSASLKCPVATSTSGGKFSVPTKQIIDWELLAGAASFGVGWGLGGFCPGPALFAAAQGIVPVAYAWWPSYFVGAYFADKLKH